MRKFSLSVTILFLSLFISETSFSQQNPEIHSQHLTAVYLLSIAPKGGGKSYTLFHKTKVSMQMKDGAAVSGKVLGVSHDSISINSKNFAVTDIAELSFNPGSILGVAAALAATAGLIAIALTIDSKNSSADPVLYGGIGLAALGAAVLIPTYFIKKHFSSMEYDFTAVRM